MFTKEMVMHWHVASYRGIEAARMLEHAIKILERVIEGRVRKIVKIDNLQLGITQTSHSISLLETEISKTFERGCCN